MAVAMRVAGGKADRSISSRRITPSRALRGSGLVSAVASLVMLVLASASGDAAAIGLGAATVTSSLGEPLRLSIPVTVGADEEVGCVQVRPGGGDLPAVFNTRAQVLRANGATRIEIRSAQAVNEPAIGLVVSVSCSSPISRDYVLFLDPPVVSSTVETGSTAVPLRRVNPMPVPVRRAPSVRPAPAATDVDETAPPRPRARPAPRTVRPKARPPAPAPRTVPDVTGTVRPPAASPPATPTTRAPGADRLSVVPTEPSPAAPAPSQTPSTPVAASPVTGTPTAGAVTALPSATPASTDAAAPASAAVDPAVVAREEALRQQQAALQAQVKSLGDQIAALRAQATTLAERNDALERTAVSPWWLIALAIVALLLAAWMSWRYLQLRRSIEGSAWWTGNTMQAEGMTSAQVASTDDHDVLDPGTRMMPRPLTRTDVRQTAPMAGSMSGSTAATSAVERAKPAPRASYPAAMDTDFTVSDIEAAMATVRTVSPPRPAKPASRLEDSDFAPLGGPTLPSPFAEPPPGAPAAAPPAKAPVAAPPPSADAAHFVDFDISPIAPADLSGKSIRGGAPAAKTPSSVKSEAREAPAAEGSDHFDPLASDSLKTTVVDGSGTASSAFGANAPTELDFELPSATQVMAITQLMDVPPVSGGRHTDSLLDDLFESSEAHGVDTILDLDERHGAPLSITEIDRLTTTDTSPPDGVDQRPKTRMARFASLMNRVDDAAAAEPLRAIAQLRQFVLRDENIPTLLWLRLFELYREVDKKAVYNALADHFARRYGRPMVPWGQTFADRVPQTPLAANPRIDRDIEAVWGTDAGLAKLEALICGHDQEDAIVFNAVLQRDLLDAAKIFPTSAQPRPDAAGAAPSKT